MEARSSKSVVLVSLQWDVRELILIIYDMIMHKHNTRKVMKCQAPRRGHSNLRSLTHLLHNHQVSFLPCIVVESGESMVKRNELSLSLRILIKGGIQNKPNNYRSEDCGKWYLIHYVNTHEICSFESRENFFCYSLLEIETFLISLAGSAIQRIAFQVLIRESLLNNFLPLWFKFNR